MDSSSEYSFPIFISSTDYNLKDLRAELARFLAELGYRPILSSAEGFPDSSPKLEPWESCLQVLEKCFVMVLVIDEKYGTVLPWPNYKEYFEDEQLAPTDGEYRFAHKTGMRMLVFIRKSLMPLYQSYRATYKKLGKDVEVKANQTKEQKKESQDKQRAKVKEALEITLPDNVSFETLEFIHKVKTTKPIPWINEFDDITGIKKEIQKKMLNELAELFLIKNRRYEIVIESFNALMDTLSPEAKKEALSKIHATKEIVEAVDNMDKLTSELEKAKSKIQQNESMSATERTKSEKKITELKKQIAALETSSLRNNDSQFFFKDGKVQIGNPNFFVEDNNSLYSGTLAGKYYGGNYLGTVTCDGCHSTFANNPTVAANLLGGTLRRCSRCSRNLCMNCWPRALSISSLPEVCPDCTQPIYMPTLKH